MLSSRRAKSEAELRLYSLPRRELQALCKQYAIPINKTNVAMADALSACLPVSFVPHVWRLSVCFAVLSVLEVVGQKYQFQEVRRVRDFPLPCLEFGIG